jgi:O-antigen/teichoic acid export membrane protein
MISGVLVGIYVARYLGPAQFGELSYALAIVAFLTVFTRLGMESILVRELAKRPEQAKFYMGTAFVLMLISAVVGVTIIGGITYLLEGDSSTRLYVWIISSGVIFQVFLVIDYSFQAQVRAKLSSIAKSAALIFSSVLKTFLVWSEADLVYFIVVYAIDYAVLALALFLIHLISRQPSFFACFRKEIVKPLLSSAWPMIMSGIATIALVKIDQLMIKNMLDTNELGLYAAAAKIYGGWVAITFALGMSLLPMLVNLKKGPETDYENRLKQLFSVFFWVSVLFSLSITVVSEDLVSLLFGIEYSAASSVLVILVWASVFASLGVMTTRYLIVEGMQKKIAKRNWIAVGINVPLNYFFIQWMGIEGAAWVTLISLFIVHYVIDWVDDDLRTLINVKNSAIFLNVLHKKTT